LVQNFGAKNHKAELTREKLPKSCRKAAEKLPKSCRKAAEKLPKRLKYEKCECRTLMKLTPSLLGNVH